MVDYLLLGGALCIAVTRNIFGKTKKEYFSGLKNLMTLNLVTAVIALVIFAVTGLDFSNIDGVGFLIISLVYGTFIVLGQTLNLMAVKNGDVSVCTMIYSSGFIFPTLFSVLILKEDAGAMKFIGLALMVVAIVLINLQISKKEKKSYFYLLFAIPSMISSGVLGILQKIFFKNFDQGQNEFLFLSFLFVIVISGACVLFEIYKNKSAKAQENQEKDAERTKKYLTAIGSYAVCAAIVYKLTMYLSGALDGMIFFPVFNGGTLIVTSMISILFLKEKSTLFKVLGIAIGVLAIVLIALG